MRPEPDCSFAMFPRGIIACLTIVVVCGPALRAEDVITEPVQVYGLGGVSTAAFSPDGTKILVGAAGNACLFDAATGVRVRTFCGHTGSVRSVAFSPDGAKILTGSYDATARLWLGGTYAPGDFDHDADVDLGDFVLFQACFSGPNRPRTLPVFECYEADMDGDADVDLDDFAVFQGCFNGPNRPAACE
jgi:hypothetical protein